MKAKIEQYLNFKNAFKDFVKFANENNFYDEEILKWIVIKVLRVKRSEFDYLKKIEFQDLERMKKALLLYIEGNSLGKIFGFIEFCGNNFKVTERVFDPRMSTETLISATKSFCDENKKYTILDLCTGSGCVAITLNKKIKSSVDAVDVSPFAIEVAKENAKNLDADVNFQIMDIAKDWNKKISKKYDFIVSNPPYWNSSKILENKDVTRDNPVIGFDGGEDGLYFIKIIIEKAKDYLNKDGMLILEMDNEQEDKLRSLLSKDYRDIEVFKDYRNIARVISAKLKN